VKSSAVDDVVLTNEADNDNNLFGVLVQDMSYATDDAAWATIDYTYTVQLPDGTEAAGGTEAARECFLAKAANGVITDPTVAYFASIGQA